MIWKQLITQVRLIAAEWLLGRALDIAPKGDHGDTMRVAILKYFEYVTKKIAHDNGE